MWLLHERWCKGPSRVLWEGFPRCCLRLRLRQRLQVQYAMWLEKRLQLLQFRLFPLLFMGCPILGFFFPVLYRSIDWRSESGMNCYNETTLIEDPNYWDSDCRQGIMQVIGEVFSHSKFPITFLNITQLSSYRKDSHTSIYKKQWSVLTPEQLANPVSYADCVHWCLPGLQDAWNELLFAELFYP